MNKAMPDSIDSPDPKPKLVIDQPVPAPPVLDDFLQQLFACLDEVGTTSTTPHNATLDLSAVLSADEFLAWLDEQAAPEDPRLRLEIVKGIEPPPPPKIWGEYWIPEAYEGIQVNFCKNPTCSNYGKPAGGPDTRVKRGRPKKSKSPASETSATASDEASQIHPVYKISGKGKNNPALLCDACGQHTTLKSNKSVYAEFMRIAGYLLASEPEPCCPDEYCANHEIPVSAGPKYYYIKGRTASGTPRYLCRCCEKSFTGKPKTTNKQTRPEDNEKVFAHVVSKVVIKKALRLLEMGPGLYYNKQELVARRCSEFLAYQERRMLNGEVQLPRLNISVDRQNYTLNWRTSEDKRRLMLYSLCSADNRTGYVFQANLNFDPRLDTEQAELEAKKCGDIHKPYPFREFAHVWLRHDYLEAEKNKSEAKKKGKSAIDADIDIDDENTEELDSNEFWLPKKGVRLREEYVMYGQFHLLRLLLHSSPHISFYLDQDPGLEKACLSAFSKEIQMGAVDAFLVSINKKFAGKEKKTASVKSSKAYKEFKNDLLGCGLSERETELAMIMHMMRNPPDKDNGNWILHPSPRSNEPEKALCHVTNTGDRDELSIAKMVLFSSQTGVNRFFNSLRTSLNPMGRSIQSASEDYKKWYPYSLYNPIYAEQIMLIFRTFYNYILVADESPDKMTPAMRLGLTDRPLTFKDVLYFDEL